MKREDPPVILDSKHLGLLLESLKKSGYLTVGPTVRDGAIVIDEIDKVTQLPVGLTDTQEGGTYRLQSRKDAAFFAYNVGPHSWKKFLFPPEQRLWTLKKNGTKFQFVDIADNTTRYAFIGVRACELQAMSIQDRVFQNGHFQDSHYMNVRKNIFVVAVNCTQAGGTCFCTSMGTGPEADTGYDLALTEVITGSLHYFVVRSQSRNGAKVLEALPHKPATAAQLKTANEMIAQAEHEMGRSLKTHNLKTLLYENYEHPHWEAVASRCLTCANCTMVCPTCFCSTVEDVTDLTGENAERWRKWDSCFSQEFSYVHGGSVRVSAKSRYRQWLTHKLGTWVEQFGTSGCVGCGRCITWCPVGIDITEEVRRVTNGK